MKTSEVVYCSNDDCPLSGNCYRWTTGHPPLIDRFDHDTADGCDAYWPIIDDPGADILGYLKEHR